MPGIPPLRARREWTEQCRVYQHRQCDHIGSARTVGLLGRRAFVTICACPCHWDCPSDEVPLPDRSQACLCAANRAARQTTFGRPATRLALDRIFSRGR